MVNRKSKLTEAQWEDIAKRILEGKESNRTIAKEYGISPAAITQRFSKQVEEIKTVANQLVALPKFAERLTINLADRLRNISEHLASAAEMGAINANKLSTLANDQINMVDSKNLENGSVALKMASALTDMANESSKIPLGLLNSNKEQVQRLNEPEAEKVKTLNEFYGRSS